MKTINDIKDLVGKYVLLRDDLNVDIKDGKISDDFRIKESIPTIELLKNAGARTVIISHLGRPGGVRNMKYSMKIVADKLAQLMNTPISFHDDALNPPLNTMNDGDIMVCENLRFYDAEENNDDEFARKLATGFDYYVNDAFGVSHRAHASIVGVTKYLPGYAGLLLTSEIHELNKIMENPVRPLLGIISGAKIKSKIAAIKSLGQICDKIILGGGIGTSVLAVMGAKNLSTDADNLEKHDAEIDAKILEIMVRFGDKIILPIDKGVGTEFSPNSPRNDKMMADILPSDVPLDEGPKTVKQYEHVIDGAKTVVWNGSLGMAEWPTYSTGTFAIARHIARRTQAGELESIIGGGDTAKNLDAAGVAGDMTYVSTGGGAFLEFIEGRELPGIAALN